MPQFAGPILQQMIGRLLTSMTCADCHIRINIDTYRLANADNEFLKAVEKVPPEITIKFFREVGLVLAAKRAMRDDTTEEHCSASGPARLDNYRIATPRSSRSEARGIA
jgi:hypothetical protein